MELSNILKGSIFIFLLFNMVNIIDCFYKRQHERELTRNIIHPVPILVPSDSGCVPCGTNEECIQRQFVCDGLCDCSGCQDELICGDLTNRNTRLFDASCKVDMVRNISTISATRTLTTTHTTTVTSLKFKTGSAVIMSTYLTVGGILFTETNFITQISAVAAGISYPAGTVCTVAPAAAMAAGADTIRLVATTLTTVSQAMFGASCFATTSFPQH